MEKCGEGVGKCMGGMGRVEKCGVGVEKCVGVWVKVDVGRDARKYWGRCGVCWGVGGKCVGV